MHDVSTIELNLNSCIFYDETIYWWFLRDHPLILQFCSWQTYWFFFFIIIS